LPRLCRECDDGEREQAYKRADAQTPADGHDRPPSGRPGCQTCLTADPVEECPVLRRRTRVCQ